MRDRILDAAAALFSRKGFHKAGMDEIARAAGVAKGSLYYHFRGKSELFRDVALRGMEGLRGELREIAGASMPVEQKVSAMIDRVTILCLDYPDLFGVVMSGGFEGVAPEDRRRVEACRAELYEYVSELLREGCEQEHIIRPINFKAVAPALVSFVHAYCRQSPVRTGRTRTLAEIREIVMRGLLARNTQD